MKVRELIEALRNLDPELPVIQELDTEWDSNQWTNLVAVEVIPTAHWDDKVGNFVQEDAAHLIMENFY